MKYAVEVARVGSLNRAAQNLLLAQPNLSRSIKELESEMGIRIFERSARGMILTPDGEEFIGYAKEILNHIDRIDKMYKTGAIKKQRFSISVPHARYISEAFAEFSKNISDGYADYFFSETDCRSTINNILYSDYKLGMIRYAACYDRYFKAFLDEKEISSELVAEFTHKLIFSRENSLSQKENITFSDLSEHIRIVNSDPFVPTLSASKVKREELSDNSRQSIYISERGSQYDLLIKNNRTYIWSSPISEDTLEKFGLIQRDCDDNARVYKDILIYKNGYKFTDLDKNFITELCRSRRKNMK